LDWIEGEMIAFFQLMSPRKRAILSATAGFFFLKKRTPATAGLLDRGCNVPSPHKFFSTRKKKATKMQRLLKQF
jgi:hypothetical protein